MSTYRRRNRGSELIVAIVVIGTLALALTFGIILTLSSNADEPDNTDRTNTAEARQNLTATGAAVAFNESPQPSATGPLFLTPSPAISPTPTRTPTPENTVTPEPPPVTPEPTEGVTEVIVVPAATEEPTDEVTAETVEPTEEPPTNTPTNTPEPSETATNTATPSPTRTLTPTLTATPTQTLSPTPSQTPSDTPTFTATPITATLTFTPYPTLTPSITPFGGERTKTPSASGCVIPDHWLPYTIQPGDTLSRLARRWNMSVNDLAHANCLENANAITAGLILYAPPGSDVTPAPVTPGFQVTPIPVTPGEPVGTPFGTVEGFVMPVLEGPSSIDCGNAAFTISAPAPDTVLRGAFALYGTATHPDFQFYRLQISGNGPRDEEFLTLMTSSTQVYQGELGTVNTAAFVPGVYWLRLTVVDNTGNYPPQCMIRVIFAS